MAGGDVKLLQELVGAFLSEVPQLLQTLRSTIDSRDAGSLQATAHQLQGVLRCLHMEQALQLARQLELIANEPADWQQIDRLMADLNTTIHTATQKLEEFMGNAG